MLFVPAIAKRQRSQMTPSTTSKVPSGPSNLGISSLLSTGYCHHYENFNQQYAHRKFPIEKEKKENAHKAENSNNNNNFNTNNTNNSNNKQQKSSNKMPTKPEQIVEAMKKLDERLVSYLSGEENLTSKSKVIADLVADNDEFLNNNYQCDDNMLMMMMTPEQYRQKQLEVFQSVTGLTLHMEALTLEAEGTRRMELLQNEIRPIFTVECQLSHELIKQIPRSEMFHIMQFESEKFQSLTQCTRFGQEAQREVRISLSNEEDPFNQLFCKDEHNKSNSGLPNLGRIHFTVWWREPGTCLNELLGMGILHLNQLYNANLLEQCKCIMIQRRNIHLANLYFKISLQVPLNKKESQLLHQQQEILNMKSNNLIMNNITAKKCLTDHKNNVFCGGCSIKGANLQQFLHNNNNNNCSNMNKNKTNNEAFENALNSAVETGSYLSSTNNNNLVEIQSNYMAETDNVRMLKGLICVNDFDITHPGLVNEQSSLFLICRNFWKQNPSIAVDQNEHSFEFFEEFNILNDSLFHERSERKCLNLEVWLSTKDKKSRFKKEAEQPIDSNGNAEIQEADIIIDDLVNEPLGVVQIPLHPFYIAYRDVEMTNRMSKAPLPVIAIDSWAPLVRCENVNVLGRLKCLLAIGTEQQIRRLAGDRSLHAKVNSKQNCKFTKSPLVPKTSPYGTKLGSRSPQPNASPIPSELLLLQMAQKLQGMSSANKESLKNIGKNCTNNTTLQQLENCWKTFKFYLNIQGALDLPLNPSLKLKKGGNKRNSLGSKRFPPDEAPSTYVTFQADECASKAYKSHEGPVFATKIIEKSVTPRWQESFQITVNTDYLFNPQKRFILKIWKKAASTDRSDKSLEPIPLNDGIIGFAALDLNVFLKGLQINGSLNIVDFNGRRNGQIIIQAYPLDDVMKILNLKHQQLQQQSSQNQIPLNFTQKETGDKESGETSIAGSSDLAEEQQFKQFEQSMNIGHLNLGEAITIKTQELQKIADNLRNRLGEVTGPRESQETIDFNMLDDWQTFDDFCKSTEDDSDMTEFEQDLNIPPSFSSSSAGADLQLKEDRTADFFQKEHQNQSDLEQESKQYCNKTVISSVNNALDDKKKQSLTDSTKNECKQIE